MQLLVLCRYMGWSWDELMTTPYEVVDIALRWMDVNHAK